MKNCRFSKKYLPLLQYYSTAYKAAPDSEKEAIHKEFNDFFNEVSIKNLDNYFTQEERDLDELTRQGTPFDAEDKKSWRTVDVPEQGLNTTNLAQFMGGNIIDVTMAINELSRRIIRATVISVNANGEVALPNISGKNEDLNMSNLSVLLNGIKMDLINIALDNSEIEAVLGKDNLPSEYTYKALAKDGKFDILLSAAVNKRGIMTAKQREAVALLNNFDSILLENCKFISIKSQYRNNPLSTADKYEWVGPTVEHYSGWGDKKEYADMVSQTSDLAKAILENLPVYKSQSGNAVYYDDGLSVGVGGFYNAMLSMSQ